MKGRLALVTVALMVVTGCVSPQQASQPTRKGADFRPDAAGLAVFPMGQRIDFGRSPKGVIPALDRELGVGRTLTLAGCPAGVSMQRQWNDLILTFSSERFVGWRQGAGSAGRVCDPMG